MLLFSGTQSVHVRLYHIAECIQRNISVLIQAMYETAIAKPTFCTHRHRQNTMLETNSQNASAIELRASIHFGWQQKHPSCCSEIVESIEVRFSKGGFFFCVPTTKKKSIFRYYVTHLFYFRKMFTSKLCTWLCSSVLWRMCCTTRAGVATFSTENLYQHADATVAIHKINSNK